MAFLADYPWPWDGLLQLPFLLYKPNSYKIERKVKGNVQNIHTFGYKCSRIREENISQEISEVLVDRERKMMHFWNLEFPSEYL